jgi:hypothetical protein
VEGRGGASSDGGLGSLANLGRASPLLLRIARPDEATQRRYVGAVKSGGKRHVIESQHDQERLLSEMFILLQAWSATATLALA